MAEVSIRLATRADVAALCDLCAEVHALHVANRPDQFKPHRAEDLARWFAEFLANPLAKAWLAERDGLAVGYVTALARETLEGCFCPARKWWDLDQISVKVAFRRSGVGRALVETVAREASAAGVRELELNSWSFNQDAHRVFQGLGFAPKVVRFELALPKSEPEPKSS